MLFLLLLGGLLSVAVFLRRPSAKHAIRIHALRYGASQFPLDQVFQNGDKTKRIPFAWLVYVVQLGNKKILIDTGFREAGARKAWQLTQYVPISEQLKMLGVPCVAITHVVLTHSHLDHAGNIDQFPNARFYLHEKAYARLLAHPLLKKQVNAVGTRLFTRFTDEVEILPGLRAFHVGGHTSGSVAVELTWRGQSFLFPGDNSYLIANCRKNRYVGAVENAAENRAFIDRYRRYPGEILAPHDPQILERYRRVGENLVEVFSQQK